MSKLNKLLQGKTVQLTPEEILSLTAMFPNININNLKKLEKAYQNKKGCRIAIDESELKGSGFASMAKKGLAKGAKFVNENKQLSQLKDQAINQGLNYAVNKAGLDGDTGELVKGLGKKAINNQMNSMAGSGLIPKNIGRKALNIGSKALKAGNKVSNAMGYDDLDDMAIDIATKQTIGRIDPTLGSIASNQLNRLVDKQVEKHTGGSMNPYLPSQLQGGSLLNRHIQTYNDKSNVVHQNSDAFLPNYSNLPMFDQLKRHRGQVGAGFKVYT